MDNKIANKLGKQYLEIVKDISKDIDQLKKIENITYDDLDKAHKKAKKTNETMNDLCLKYPELGERLNFDFDSYFSKSPSKVMREKGWASLPNKMENAKKIEKENEYKKMFEITKRAHIEAINETNSKQSNILKSVGQEKNNVEKQKGRLQVKQIALIHVYEEWQITEYNGSEIAERYEYINKKSGHGLYQDYLSFMNPNDRTAEPTNCSKLTFKNKIKLFESILPKLTDKAKKKALSDIQILKDLFDSMYPKN